MNKTYFKYLLKSKKSLCVVVTVLYLLSFIMVVTSGNFNSRTFIDVLTAASIVLGILSYVLVPIFFNYVHNKKAVDTYFALPVSRKETLVTTLVFIDLIILVPFIILAFAAFMIGIAYHGINSMWAYIAYVLVAIIGVIVTTLFNASLFLEANSNFDGIVMMIAYSILPFIFFALIESFQESCIAGFSPLNSEHIISYISLPTCLIGTEVGKIDIVVDGVGKYANDLIVFAPKIRFVVCILLHVIISIVCLKRNYIERKVERAETVSNRFFSYPFIIYSYTALIILSMFIISFPNYREEYVIFTILIFICFMIANFVYRRKIKIELKDIIFFIITVIITISISLLANKTKGFGLAYNYEHNPSNYAFEYRTYSLKEKNDDSEIMNLIVKNYPDADSYEFYIRKFIDKNEMDKNRNLIDFIESKRSQSIDMFYKKEYSSSNVSIYTNYDENDVNINDGLYQFYENSNKYAHYYFAPDINIADLKTIGEYCDIEIYVYEKNGSMQEITINDLIK